MKKTKIVATYGPSVASPEKVRKLVNAGVNLFRVNCSHGTKPDFLAAVKVIREGTRRAKYPVGLIFDIAGLKLRLERFEGQIPIVRGQQLILTSGKSDVKHGIIGVNHPGVVESVEKGQRLFIDDGQLLFEILSVDGKRIKVKAVNSGTLLPAKGINLPDTKINIPTITKKDKEDIRTAVEAGADFIALSFVRSSADIAEARRLISRANGRLRIIAKLEKREAIDALDEIMVAADGVMIARGDLGVELPPAQLPRTQKRIIELANRYHKPVIVATQMLESMRFSPRATRAEINDVASAVFDYADAVMLSAETASGEYPEEAVATMSAVLMETEPVSPPHPNTLQTLIFRSATAHAIAEAVSHANVCCPTNVICTFTTSGYTAEMISNLFPSQIIVALTPDKMVLRQLTLHRSVYPVLIKQPRSFEEMLSVVDKTVQALNVAQKGELVVITGGTPFGSTVPTNFLKYHQVH
ncbi:MAG: pyruvate kinase [candidate division Zixibacteria bacterium]|nr:pyruvate kinase [candidate division Zixibacteria bacterium]